MSRIIVGDITAWFASDLVGPEVLKLAPKIALGKIAYYNGNMASAGWTPIGTATIRLVCDDEKKMVESKIIALKREIEAVQANAERTITMLRGNIANLLAIENQS